LGENADAEPSPAAKGSYILFSSLRLGSPLSITPSMAAALAPVPCRARAGGGGCLGWCRFVQQTPHRAGQAPRAPGSWPAPPTHGHITHISWCSTDTHTRAHTHTHTHKHKVCVTNTHALQAPAVAGRGAGALRAAGAGVRCARAV